MNWDLLSVGFVLLSGSLVLAGVLVAAQLAGLLLPGGPLLLMTILVLVVMGASVLVAADYRRERMER